MSTQNSFPRMHVSLYVADIASTVNFYTSFFGRPADKVKKGYAKYILEAPSLVISFVENAEKVQQEFGHLGFQTETLEDMTASLDKMKSMGVSVREEMGTNCCFARQDKFWVADPDGHQWEVYFFHEDVEFNDPHHTTVEAVACCSPSDEAEASCEPKQEVIKEKINISNVSDQKCEPGSGCC
ncbi:MAG: catechol 2,3-dioxygenase-like lactoylglutathione lyase family enzyme [Flavobacteriales bacterium]|jgi:catechol 2,3-dioxygenase-like lactoylglutathione lyase family enzyme